MTLTIQEISANLASLRKEIAEVKRQLTTTTHANPDKFKQLLDVCERHNNQLSEEIKASKRKNFERDASDYENGRVYQWKNPTEWRKRYTRTANQHPHRGHLNFTPQHSASDLEYDSESSSHSHASGSFLERGTKDDTRPLQSAGRRNAGGGRPPAAREPYATRQRHGRYIT